MPTRPKLLLRLRTLFRKSHLENEMDDELRFHLEHQIEDNIKAGMNPQEARRAALIAFGGVEKIREECRDTRRVRFFQEFRQDLRHGFRILFKSPTFTVGALLAIALGIGANTAIFSVVDAVLFRPLPFEEAERLVSLYEENLPQNRKRAGVSPANFVDWKARSQAFEGIAAIGARNLNLTGPDEPEQILGMLVTADFFRVLRARAALGRVFLPEEYDSPAAAALGQSVRRAEEAGTNRAAVILSNGLWQRRFGGRQDAIGSLIELDGRQVTVVGVMRRDFAFTEMPGWGTAECWIPQSYRENENPKFRQYIAIARLKPSVALKQAQAEMEVIAQQLEAKRPEANNGWKVEVVPLRDTVVGDTRRELLVLWGAVGFVLLIACTNTANLILARATARQREIAVRAAMGASRRRLIQQLLTESTLLAMLGGLAGFTVAAWGIQGLLALAPENLPRLNEIRIDARVFGFALLLSLITGSMAGVLPAMKLSKTEVIGSLKDNPATSVTDHRWLRNALAVAEIGLALVLLIGAGLMFRSFLRLQALHLGFNPQNVLSIGLNPRRKPYQRDLTRDRALRGDVVERVKGIPGVEAAAVGGIPLTSGAGVVFYPEGKTEGIRGGFDAPSPDYFRVLQIRLLKGRSFTDADVERTLTVAVLNRAAADRAWPGENSIGKRFTFDDVRKEPWITVIGVVENVRTGGLEIEPRPEVYLPLEQSRIVIPGNMLIRTKRDPLQVLADVRSAIRTVDKDMPLTRIATMEQRLSRAMAPRRFNFVLIGTFSVLAFLLAAVGIYGIVAYNTTRRTHEIGVRMALGAEKQDILRMILHEGALLFALGECFGLAAAFALNRTIASMLFRITPTDPSTYVGVSLLWAAVVFLACYIPAWRAARVDPMVALRHE